MSGLVDSADQSIGPLSTRELVKLRDRIDIEIAHRRAEAPQPAIWNAINAYAAACGGDTSATTAGPVRSDAVAEVNRVLRAVLAGGDR